jgi:prevent-host-death family protein
MKPTAIGASDAKTHLADLLEQVQHGKTFCITKRGRPVAELRPMPPVESRLCFGCDKGRVILHKDFDAALPGMKPYEP